jgi:glycine cleavage system H protein
MNLPADLKYTNEHEWIKIDPESGPDDQTVARIGITDFAQQELGELVYVEVESVGEQLEKDAVFGTVEAVKTTSDLFMPVAGKVIAFNPELDEAQGDNPGMVNEDPYESGWIIKIALDDPSTVAELMSAEDYAELIS